MNKDDARKLSPAEQHEQHERRRQVIRAHHEEKVQRIICGKRPEQLKMELALWSRAAVTPRQMRGLKPFEGPIDSV